jgi:hypothetical protein
VKISIKESSTTAHTPIHRASQFINPATLKEEDEICFIRAQNRCVCFVDIVDQLIL